MCIAMSSFKQTGGARLDSFNATLSGNPEALRLACLGREYHFPRNSIRRLRRHRGIFSVGLCIEHTQDSLPQFVVFWASLFFWTSGFQKLKTQLESAGYKVAA